MKKISKVSLTMLVLTLSVFVAAGMASANCVAADGTVFGCGSVVTKSCTFDDNMICATNHGLIIGEAVDPTTSCTNPLIIDGDGFTLSGAGTDIASRHCRAASFSYGSYGDIMLNLPFMCAADSATPGQCDGCIDSGIVNAQGYAHDGTGGNCQEGYDNITVKNLDITGWCTGIFMAGKFAGYAVPPEHPDTLTCILIEGNCIHDCGNSDCGNFVQNGSGGMMEGKWEIPNCNDGIFLAGCGMPTVSFIPGTAEYPTVVDYECAECKIGNTECPDLVQGVDNSCTELPAHRCIVRHNLINNIKGCGSQAFFGGNGISMNGSFTGCNEVAKNVIKNCAMSGIETNAGTNFTRFHGNYITGCGYGGMVNGCGGCVDNYFYGNVCDGNYGAGIGYNAVRQKIKNNILINNKLVHRLNADESGQHGFEMFDQIWRHGVDGTGISLGSGYHGAVLDHELIGNTCVGNETMDILVADLGTGTVGVTGDQNKCRTAENYTDLIQSTCLDANGDRVVGPCTYCAPDRLNCRADLDHDCDVDGVDNSILIADYFDLLYTPGFSCCPSPW